MLRSLVGSEMCIREGKYTARDMPEQNHLAELGFAVLDNHSRGLLYQANLPRLDQSVLWQEASVCSIAGWTDDYGDCWHIQDLVWAFIWQNTRICYVLEVLGRSQNSEDQDQDDTKGGQSWFTVHYGWLCTRSHGWYLPHVEQDNMVYITYDIIWLNRMFYEAPVGIGPGHVSACNWRSQLDFQNGGE